MNSRTENNYTENRKTIQKINEPNSWFFGESDKINDHLARQNKEGRNKKDYERNREITRDVLE